MTTGIKALLSTWQGRFIAVFVLVQLLLPLHYYLARKDHHDERFAWRMFSPMRMARCATTVAIDDKPANLGGEFHEAWLEIASRGRFSVLEAMGARLCTKYPKSKVRLSIQCTYLDREPQTFGGYDMCTVPYL
ncbi:MAG: hypothetical protein H0T42_08530 [Deltaproteobacteria bacterium]|nr:hypothetical protein [Deltaproteobacteria bacterium]